MGDLACELPRKPACVPHLSKAALSGSFGSSGNLFRLSDIDRDRHRVGIGRCAVRGRHRQRVGAIEVQVALVGQSGERRIDFSRRAGNRHRSSAVAADHRAGAGGGGQRSVRHRQRGGERGAVDIRHRHAADRHAPGLSYWHVACGARERRCLPPNIDLIALPPIGFESRCARHFALHGAIERHPGFFQLWGECRAKLLFQAPYQRVAKRIEMR
jgi:hypothetical protein